MPYVDGFVIAVPKKNLGTYERMARMGAKIWKEYGALSYYECVGDDLAVKWGGLGFKRLAKLKPGETVVFSWIVYRSRAHRDRVNAQVMKDPRMSPEQMKDAMPFDMKRMAYGGFKALVSW
jgi:alkaline phosphatase